MLLWKVLGISEDEDVIVSHIQQDAVSDEVPFEEDRIEAAIEKKENNHTLGNLLFDYFI